MYFPLFLSILQTNIKNQKESVMEFYGLFGETLSHSLSPELHKKIYQITGIDAAYKTFAFPKTHLKQAVESIRLLSLHGVNVTIPYKEKIIPYLDALDPFAEKIGAVNTVQNKNGKLIGYNTDYAGFGHIFTRRNWNLKDKSAVILGTGGAAKIVEAYLINQGIKQIVIVSRSPEKYTNTEKTTYTNYTNISSLSGDYLINTTPVGMFPNIESAPVNDAIIQQFSTLIDLIYNPQETKLLSLGHQHNKHTANGLDMLVGQAVRAVEIWENLSIEETIIDELIEIFQKERVDINEN